MRADNGSVRLPDRALGLGTALASGLALVALGPLRGVQRYPGGTAGWIYPWWAWVLAGAGVLAGLVILVLPDVRIRSTAAGVASMVGLQIAGLGVVGWRHWEAAIGFGGPISSSLSEVETRASVLAVAGLATSALAVARLVADHSWGEVSRRRTTCCVAAGALVIVLLPLVLWWQVPLRLDADLQSWGAFGLVYGGPWGLALIAGGLLVRPAAVGILVATGGSAGCAALGPQMYGLVNAPTTFLFALVAVLALVAAAAVGRGPYSSRRWRPTTVTTMPPVSAS